MDAEKQGSQRRFRLRTEGARERDVFRHLHPWAHEYKNSGLNHQPFLAESVEGEPEPQACPDTALVAFAQLCALRLRARRCFVSLISSSVEYVLVECTQTLSLQYNRVDDIKDKACLGTCSFLRDEGLNAYALDSWRRAPHLREAPNDPDFYYTQGASAHWHIISDVRGDDQYAQRGFVKRNPGIRFYASVPIRGNFGSVLGSLAIIDDTPRYGLGNAEMSFMEDVADTITEHLHATVVRSQRRRSERLIKSLGLFNSGKSSLRHWWLKQEDSRISNVARHKVHILTPGERHNAANNEFGVQESSSSSDRDLLTPPRDEDAFETNGQENIPFSPTSLQNANARVARDQASVTVHDFAQRESDDGVKAPQSHAAKLVETKGEQLPVKLAPMPEKPHSNSRIRSTTNEGFDLTEACRRMYARASNLMREAMGADGVVFINANVAVIESRSSTSNSDLRHNRTNVNGCFLHSDTDASDSPSGTRLCSIDAFSATEMPNPHSIDRSHHFDISESFLSLLIRRYPQGRIFNFTQDGASYSGSGEESMGSGSNSDSRAVNGKQRISKDGKRLGEIMPGAKTIAFYPIWDENNGCWCSGVFVWSTSPLRYFDEDENMTYLASWSHSILAELGRLRILAEDRAKGSFISSVSHELRSPLHGILGGVEFLQESELTSFQQEMTQTISMAGRALLDTVDHILDYAKISSFTRSQRRQRARVGALQNHNYNASSRPNSDEIGVTAYVDLARLTEEVVETLVSAYRFQNLRTPGADSLSLAINIPWRKNWVVELQPGGWTRILNNLVGNSLKYTKEGIVSVRIEIGQAEPGDEALHSIKLTVHDTGIGMQKSFLSSDLYTPFKQEDSSSSGTGLGLSIVRQICKDMNADLKISSELGEGTCATVDLKLKFVAESVNAAAVAKTGSSHLSSRELNVDYFYCITPDTTSHSSSPVEDSVCETAKEWLGCDARRHPMAGIVGESVVCAIAEDDLLRWANEGPNALRLNLADITKTSSHVLILARSLESVSISVPLEGLPLTPIFVHQPIGPYKLLRAIICDKSATELGFLGHERPTSIDALSTPSYRTVGISPLSPSSLDNAYFGKARPGQNKSLKDGIEATRPRGPSNQSFTPSSAVSTAFHHSAKKPVSPANSSITSSSSSTSATPNNEGGGARGLRDTVLLVEDNEVNMKLLTALMRKLSVPHQTAANGREGLNAYRATPSSFLLVLMDMSMPIMDGFTSTAKIRETERKHRLSRCTIVALTGVTSNDAKSRAFACGVDEFFSKPVHMKEVKELIDKVRSNEHFVQQTKASRD